MRFIPRNSVNLTFETVLRSIFDSSPKKTASGNYVREFERRFAEFVGVNYALGVYSARAGLHLILKCLGLNPGEEIILSAYNFAPVPILFKLMGYNPVFVDIKERTPNIDVDKIEEAIGPKSRVLFVTHMCGHPVNMDRIMKIAEKYGLFVIEDCAHALGATYKGRMVGSFGAAGIFSFGYGKTMPCFGGGMILMN